MEIEEAISILNRFVNGEHYGKTYPIWYDGLKYAVSALLQAHEQDRKNIVRLQDALATYGNHTAQCSVMLRGSYCDCGLLEDKSCS